MVETRPYKLFWGLAYPNLHRSKDKPTVVTADTKDRKAYYNDAAIKLSNTDIKRFIGKPVCYEHNEEDVVGKIVAATTDSKGHMRIAARVYVDTKQGRRIISDMKKGVLTGLSVGYEPIFKNSNSKEISYKSCDEISICKTPFFNGANIKVTASKNLKSKSRKNFINFKIQMSSTDLGATPVTTETEQQTVVPIPENNEAKELLLAADESAQELEHKTEQFNAMQLKMKEMSAALAVFEEQKAKEKKAYEDKRVEEFKKQLAMEQSQYKSANGEDAVLPKEYINSIEKAWKHKIVEPVANVMASKALYTHKLEEENRAMKRKLEEQDSSIKASKERLVKRKVEASNDLVYTQSAPENTFNATEQEEKEEDILSNIFMPAPSRMEKELQARVMERQELSGVAIKASAGRQKKPTFKVTHGHKITASNNIMSKHSPSLFGFFMENCQAFDNIPVRNFKYETFTANPEL